MTLKPVGMVTLSRKLFGRDRPPGPRRQPSAATASPAATCPRCRTPCSSGFGAISGIGDSERA